MSQTDARAFIEKLKDESFRSRLLPSLMTVNEGDWDAVVDLAAQSGFHFTREELEASTPPGFFKGAGRRPDLGWDRSTRSR